MWGYRRHEPGDGLIAILLYLGFIIIAMPIVGLIGMCSNNETDKSQGTALFVIGIIIWIVAFIIGCN